MDPVSAARHRPSSLHDHVAAQIRDMIVDQVLLPGEVIDEMALARALDVSRHPVREALKVLRSEGLIEIRPGRGARVISLTPDGVRDLYEVMAGLETLAVRAVCERASDEDIALLDGLHKQMRDRFVHKDLRTYSRLNQDIHEAIVSLAGNVILAEMYAQISVRARVARFGIDMEATRWIEAMKEHDALNAAIQVRDGRRATEILQKHLAIVSSILREQLVAPISAAGATTSGCGLMSWTALAPGIEMP